MNRSVSRCSGKTCIPIFWKKKDHQARLILDYLTAPPDISSLQTPPSLSEKIEGGGGAGNCTRATADTETSVFFGLLFDNRLGFETAEKLLKCLKGINSWENKFFLTKNISLISCKAIIYFRPDEVYYTIKVRFRII